MEFKWYIEPSDIDAVKSIVVQQASCTLVIDRIKRNVDEVLPEINQEAIWLTHVMCLLTSQQRSGPNNPVSNFLSKKPFPLSLQKCKNAQCIKSFANSILSSFQGIRFTKKIPEQIAANLRHLEGGGWKDLITWLEKLKLQRLQPPTPSHYQLEREAALYKKNSYVGFGPKQSRNFWQELGLTRYEFVLDSRVTKWLKQIKFPIPLFSEALSHEEYYIFLSEILRELCIQADILPCVLDAAVFASYDAQEKAS